MAMAKAVAKKKKPGNAGGAVRGLDRARAVGGKAYGSGGKMGKR